MPKLKLVSLICNATDDSGELDENIFDTNIEDEPYILVDKKRVWGVKLMKTNDSEDLTEVTPIQFTDKVSIELWDRDAEYFPADDLLGRLTVNATKTSLGEQKHRFKRRSAFYTLTYRVD